MPEATRRHDEVLADIARFAGSSLELPEVLERIVERAAALTGADRASIWLLDRSGQHLLPSALFGMDSAFTYEWKRHPLPLAEERLSQEVIATGQTAVVEDATIDQRTDKASVEFFGDQSILVVPLARRGRVIGTLFVNHVRQRYHFTEEDTETATTIAAQAAVAIDNAQLYGEARRLADQLHRSFRHAGEALATGADVGANLEHMLQLAVETTGADGGALELLEEDHRTTYAIAQAGRAPDEGVARSRFPLQGAAGLLGTLELWRESGPFSDGERALLAAFAGHARSAIEHARLYANLQEERKRALQAERSQAEFSSMISHELRTPLALIKGYSATLLRPPVPLAPERTRRFIEGIDSAATRLQRLIDNLLSASRLESDMFTISPQPLEVQWLVQRAVSAAAVLDQQREIRVDLPEGELWVLGDADQLAQVLENLVSNALKYAPGNDPVRVSAARDETRVRLSVVDTGPGVPREAIERIFDKFFRIGDGASTVGTVESQGRPATTHPRGLGLGLYICRHIVQAHGGRIWAENGPEGGSVFHVELAARANPGRDLT